MNWFKKYFSRPPASQTPPSDPAAAPRMAHFLQLIAANDVEAIEGARDEVQPSDVPELLNIYPTLQLWAEKRALIELIQDQHAPGIEAVMLDFLRAPVAVGDELTELAKAIALGFIDEKYDRFMVYYQDRQALQHDVNTVLRKNGLEPEPPPETPQPAAAPASPSPPVSPNQHLMNCATSGDLAGVKQALADGAKINVEIGSGDYIGCTPLLMAMMRQRFDVAEYLIAQDANIHHTRKARFPHQPDRGQTALWWAANHNQMRLAHKLLDMGANVNTPDHHGGTPLGQAASSGHHEMVRFLLNAGADPFAPIYDGRIPFNLAVTHGHTRVVEILLDAGCDANFGGSSGYAPLMVAAENGYLDMAKLLIRRGANVNATHPGKGLYAGLHGWTPLVFAVRGGYVRMTQLLIRAGADVNWIVAAGINHRGQEIPERRVIDFVHGKRAESIREHLRRAGATEGTTDD